MTHFEPIDPMDPEHDRAVIWVRARLRNNQGAVLVTLLDSDHDASHELLLDYQDPRDEAHYYRARSSD